MLQGKGFLACHSNQNSEETQWSDICQYNLRILLLRRRKKTSDGEGLVEQAILCCPHCRTPLRLIDLLPEHLRVLKQGTHATAIDTLETIEAYVISRVVSQTHNLEWAARLLGIGRTTLYRRRKKYGIGDVQSDSPPPHRNVI